MTASDVTTAVERVRAAVAAAASSWDTQARVDVDDLIKLTDELDRLSAALGEAERRLDWCRASMDRAECRGAHKVALNGIENYRTQQQEARDGRE